MAAVTWFEAKCGKQRMVEDHNVRQSGEVGRRGGEYQMNDTIIASIPQFNITGIQSLQDFFPGHALQASPGSVSEMNVHKNLISNAFFSSLFLFILPFPFNKNGKRTCTWVH